MTDKQKTQKTVSTALREIGAAYGQVDDKVYERAEKRLDDREWGGALPRYSGHQAPDYFYEAAVHECARTVVESLANGSVEAETLLERGGAIELAPSPEAMAIYHAFAKEQAIYLIDEYLAKVLSSDACTHDLPTDFESRVPESAYIATPIAIISNETDEMLEAAGFFMVVLDEVADNKNGWQKRVVVAAVEDTRRPRVVVASVPQHKEDCLEEARLETALANLAIPYIAYFAKERPDVMKDEAPRHGGLVATFFKVGENERLTNRHLLLLHQNTSKAA